MGWAGCRAAVRGQGSLRGKHLGQVPGVREGLPNPQARIKAFQVLLCSVPILLMMRKLSEAQHGKVWQRLSKDEELAFIPNAGQLGGWLVTQPLCSSQAWAQAAAMTQRGHRLKRCPQFPREPPAHKMPTLVTPVIGTGLVRPTLG